RRSGGIGRRASLRGWCPQGRGGSSPPSDTNPKYTRVAGFDVDPTVGVVREAHAQLLVDATLDLRIGSPEHGHDVLEPQHQRLDLRGREGTLRRLAAELTLEATALLVDLGDPVTDHCGLGAALEDLAISSELALTFL